MTSPYLNEIESVKYIRIEHLKKPVEFIQRLCRDDKVKFVKRGRDYLFKPEWLDAYLTGRTV